MSGVDPTSLEKLVCQGWQKYHAGDKEVLNDIYDLLMPFCLRVCSRTCGTYITNSDEEASIARLAILETFDNYQPDKGPILVYLGRVIRNRLIDYKRRENRKRTVSLADMAENSCHDSLAEDHSIENLIEEMARKNEVERFINLLNSYGITVAELQKSSPRQARTREKAKAISCQIAADPEMRQYLLDKKMLPVKLLENQGFFKRKLLDRYRRYIIAGALILINDLEFLKSYIWPRQGGTDFAQ